MGDSIDGGTGGGENSYEMLTGQLDTFFGQGSDLRNLVIDIQRIGMPGFESSQQTYRQARMTNVVRRARQLFAEAVGEALSETAVSAEGFNFEDKLDQADFTLAIQAAGILELRQLNDQEDMTGFFEVLTGADADEDG